MKLLEALQHEHEISKRAGEPLAIGLACGFTPLHLKTFLAAHLASHQPTKRLEIHSGLFGETIGNIERLKNHPVAAVAIVLEWSDLDPRLGLRALGGWRPSDLNDILVTATTSLARLNQAITKCSASTPVVISMPSLPLPPIAYTSPWQTSAFELELKAAIAGFSAKLSQVTGVRIVRMEHLDALSPPSQRLDVPAQLRNGFPYTLVHADVMAQSLARMIAPPAPKKGLITDLDDTLWRGIIGEVGVAGVTWHLDAQSHSHGLYQQILASLAEAGVLVAVASKNESAVVEEALCRPDLILDASKVYPREIHWGPKSESVARILETWNIAPDAVVFLDDSPMELAEVKTAFPAIECLAFPTHDDASIYRLLERLRDFFGKPALSREDSLRLMSLRAATEAKREAVTAGIPVDPDRLLQDAKPVLAHSFEKEPFDPRALELVNKTNQFNLNGYRYSEAQWHAHLADPCKFLLRVAYEDKFGPLGTIAVMGGQVVEECLNVDFWVMSCRAFSRRIEHCSLLATFERFGVQAITFNFQETPQNGALRESLAGLVEGVLEPGVSLSRDTFSRRCPILPHLIKPWTTT